MDLGLRQARRMRAEIIVNQKVAEALHVLSILFERVKLDVKKNSFLSRLFFIHCLIVDDV